MAGIIRSFTRLELLLETVRTVACGFWQDDINDLVIARDTVNTHNVPILDRVQQILGWLPVSYVI